MRDLAQVIVAGLVVSGVAVVSFQIGYREVAHAPVSVRVVHEESGELSEAEVYRDGELLRIDNLTEQWRGAGPDGTELYDIDPAPATVGEGADNTTSS